MTYLSELPEPHRYIARQAIADIVAAGGDVRVTDVELIENRVFIARQEQADKLTISCIITPPLDHIKLTLELLP